VSFTLEAKTPGPVVDFDNRWPTASGDGRCAEFAHADFARPRDAPRATLPRHR